MMVSKNLIIFVLSIIYVSFIFRFLLCFLKLKQGLLQKAAAIAGVWIVGCTVVFPEDPFNVFGMLVLFAMVLLICFEGSVVRRLSVVLLLYPIIVSVNFVTLDATGIVFFRLTPQTPFWDAALNAFSMLLRDLIWMGIYFAFRKKAAHSIKMMTDRMWLLMDIVCAAAFAGSITLISTISHKDAWLTYPSCLACVVTSLGCIWLAAYIGETIRRDMEMENMKVRQAYYEELEKNQLAVRMLRHDMNNHLGVIGSFLEEKEYDKALAYFKELNITAAARNRKFCENSLVNAVINAKYNLALEKNIDCFVNIELDNLLAMDDVSLCTIFANLLDNAIEAAQKVPDREARRISLKARYTGESLCIEVENSRTGELAESKAGLLTTKPDKENHGYGLRSVRDVVESYGGHMDITPAANAFRVTIWIGSLV